MNMKEISRITISAHTEKGKNDMELISRDEAIVMLEDMEGRRDEDGYIRIYKCDVIDNLRSLPAVEERREGRWKQTKAYSEIIFCSECGEPFKQSNSADTWNYCPNCGARMEKEK